jgi:hypothetical protein
MVKSSAAIRVAPLGDDSRNDPIRSTSEETSGNRSVPAELGLQQAHSFVDTRLAFLACLGPEAASGPRFPWVQVSRSMRSTLGPALAGADKIDG